MKWIRIGMHCKAMAEGKKLRDTLGTLCYFNEQHASVGKKWIKSCEFDTGVLCSDSVELWDIIIRGYSRPHICDASFILL